jgi:hypothetical protein
MQSNKSYDKKDDHKRNHFKKKSDKAMHNDQSFHQAPAICLKEGVNLVLDHLCALGLALTLIQAIGATTIIMSTKMIASTECSPQARAFTQAQVFVLQ